MWGAIKFPSLPWRLIEIGGFVEKSTGAQASFQPFSDVERIVLAQSIHQAGMLGFVE
jgi:hypothetical protein